jgi:hypothetical protein
LVAAVDKLHLRFASDTAQAFLITVWATGDGPTTKVGQNALARLTGGFER